MGTVAQTATALFHVNRSTILPGHAIMIGATDVRQRMKSWLFQILGINIEVRAVIDLVHRAPLLCEKSVNQVSLNFVEGSICVCCMCTNGQTGFESYCSLHSL